MATPGGDQELLCVNERGLYRVIFRSDKPEAIDFQRWVTGTVLPTIRKTGAYVAPGASVEGIAAAAGSSGNLLAANALLQTLNGMLPGLCSESRQALAVGVLGQIGIALPAPEIEQLWQMSEIADRFGVALVVGAVVSGASMPAQARVSTVLGQGNLSCGKWLADRADRSKFHEVGELANTTWVLGFLSGSNVYKGGSDLLADQDTQGVVYWLDNYCRSNPTSKVYQALKVFVERDGR